MKLILFFCINIAFADVLSDWIDSNSHIINSKSYKISFKQRFETTIENSVHYSTIPSDFVYLNNNLKYESNEKIVIANKDSLKMLNKYSNQVFIDNITGVYEQLLSVDLYEELLNAKFKKDKDHYFINNDSYQIEVYFSDIKLKKVVILHNDMKIDLLDFELSSLCKDDMDNFFKFGNNSSEIFDLRIR